MFEFLAALALTFSFGVLGDPPPPGYNAQFEALGDTPIVISGG
jgi:hypothetical protein